MADNINNQRTPDQGGAPKIAQAPGRDGKGISQDAKKSADEQTRETQQTQEQAVAEAQITKEKEKQLTIQQKLAKLSDPAQIEKRKELEKFLVSQVKEREKVEVHLEQLQKEQKEDAELLAFLKKRNAELTKADQETLKKNLKLKQEIREVEVFIEKTQGRVQEYYKRKLEMLNDEQKKVANRREGTRKELQESLDHEKVITNEINSRKESYKEIEKQLKAINKESELEGKHVTAVNKKYEELGSILSSVKEINDGVVGKSQQFNEHLVSIANTSGPRVQETLATVNSITAQTSGNLLNIRNTLVGVGVENEDLIKQGVQLADEYVKYQNSVAETQKELAEGKSTDKEALDSAQKQKALLMEKINLIDTSTESGKKLYDTMMASVGATDSILNNMRRNVMTTNTINESAIRMKNLFGESSEQFAVINKFALETEKTMGSVSDQIGQLGVGQEKLAAQVQSTADKYIEMQEIAAKAYDDVARGIITAEQAASAIDAAKQSYEEMRDAIDQSSEAGKNLVASFKEGEKNVGSIQVGMQKAVEQSSMLKDNFTEAGKLGVGGVAEMGPVIDSIRKKDLAAFKVAFVAMAVAMAATLTSVLAGPFQEATRLSYEYKQKELDFQVTLLDLDAQRAQVNQRAAAEFTNTMKQNAIAFNAASKTALFGKGIGSVNYGTAQLQQMGISAETIASTMTTISNTTGKMPTARLASDMAVFAQRSGMSADEVAGLNEAIMLTSDTTAEAALNLQAGIQGLAEKIGISFGDLAKEISAASKDMLSYGIKNVGQLAKQVAYAKSLGVSFQEIANAGKSMVMNYQQSIKAEMELSALLGESVDLSEVRAKFAEGDQKGAMEALKAQGLNPEEMDMFQQEALKSALGGMDISSIQKISTKEGKTAELGSVSAEASNKEYIDTKLKAEQTMQVQTANLAIDKAVVDAKLDLELDNIKLILQQDSRANLAHQGKMLDMVKGIATNFLPVLVSIATTIAMMKMSGGIGGMLGMGKGGAGGAVSTVAQTGSKVAGNAVAGGANVAASGGAAAAGGGGIAGFIKGLARALRTPVPPLGTAAVALPLFFLSLGASLLMAAPAIEAIAPVLIKIAEVIGTVLVTAIKEFAPVILEIAKVIGTVLVEALKQAGPIITAVLQGIAGVIDSVGNSIAKVVTAVGSAIEGIITTMSNSIKSLSDIDPLKLYALAGGITAVGLSLAAFGAGSGAGAVVGAIGGAIAKGINFISGQDTRDPFERLKEMAGYSEPIVKLAGSVSILSASMNQLGTISVDTENLNRIAAAIGKVAQSLASFGGGAELGGAISGAFAKGVKFLSGQSTQDPFERLKEMASYTDPILKLADAMNALSSSMATLSTMNLDSLNKINWTGMTAFYGATQVSKGIGTVAEGVGNAFSSIGTGIKNVMSYVMPSSTSTGSTTAAGEAPVKTPQDIMIAELKGINKNTKTMVELTKAIEMLTEAQYLYDTSGTKIKLAIDGRQLGVALERKRKNLQGTNYSNFNTNG